MCGGRGDSCATREPPIGWGQCPSRLPPAPPPGGLAARPAARGGGWRCQTGRGRGAGGGGAGRGPGAARHGRPRPGPYAALSSPSPPPPPPPRPAARSVLTPSSTPRPRRPPRGSPAAPRAPARLASRAPGSPARARLAPGHTLVSPRALGSRRRAERAGSTVAAAAGWPASHGGRWGRRADETATHPGNEQGEGAAGGGAPRRWGGRAARRQRRGRGGRRGLATSPGPGAPRHPLCVAAPGAGARGRRRRAEGARGAAGSAPRASSPPVPSAQPGRDPGTPAGPGSVPGPRPSLLPLGSARPASRALSRAGVSVPAPRALEFRSAPREPALRLRPRRSSAPPVSSPGQR